MNTPNSPHVNDNIYSGFAAGYDLVMRDVDYELWADHVLHLLDQYQPCGKRLLNLACGTGNMESFWLAKGFEIVSLDQSDQMLAQARSKTPETDNLKFVQGDMREFELGQKFDVICCLYDSLNYLTEAADVQSFFRCVGRHLAHGGRFVFDVATEANIIENFSNITYAENLPDFAYIWDNQYNLTTKICRSDFVFFHRQVDTVLFERATETHFQRMYSTRDLNRWLRLEGFKVLGMLDGFTTDPAHSQSDRIHLVACKA